MERERGRNSQRTHGIHSERRFDGRRVQRGEEDLGNEQVQFRRGSIRPEEGSKWAKGYFDLYIDDRDYDKV